MRTGAHVGQRDKTEHSQQDINRTSVTRSKFCHQGRFGKEAVRVGWSDTGFLRESISAPEKEIVLVQDGKSEKVTLSRGDRSYGYL